MPEAKDGGVRLVAINDNLEFWFKETIDRGDDNVEGEDDEIIFLGPPLEVMLRADLNRGGVSEGGGNDGFVVRNMKQLGGGEAFVLKGP